MIKKLLDQRKSMEVRQRTSGLRIELRNDGNRTEQDDTKERHPTVSNYGDILGLTRVVLLGERVQMLPK